MSAIESSTTAPANIEKMYNIYINLDIFLNLFLFFICSKKWLTCNYRGKNSLSLAVKFYSSPQP